MSIMNFCQSNVVTISPHIKLKEAASVMDDRSIGCLLVTDSNNRPVGILTDRDIALRGLASESDPRELAISAIMSKDVVTADLTSEVADVIRLMREKHVRRIVITEKSGNPVGIVTTDDLMGMFGREMTELSDLIRFQVGTSTRRVAHDFTKMA